MSKRRGAVPQAKRSAGAGGMVWVLVVGAVILGGAILGVALSYGMMTSQTPSIQSSQKAIVGKWVNAKGGEINFNADGSGYIPPGPGIEAYSFTYAFRDPTHLEMKVAGQTMTIEVKLVGDKLTWLTADPNVSYEYTRVK